MQSFISTESLEEIQQRLIVYKRAAFLIWCRDNAAPKCNHARARAALRPPAPVPSFFREIHAGERRRKIFKLLNERDDAWTSWLEWSSSCRASSA